MLLAHEVSLSLLDGCGRRYGAEDAGKDEEEEKEKAQGFLLSLSSSRCSHSEIWTFFYELFFSGSLRSVSGCCLRSAGCSDFSGRCRILRCASFVSILLIRQLWLSEAFPTLLREIALRIAPVAWTFFCVLLVPGSHVLGDCLARGAQEYWAFLHDDFEPFFFHVPVHPAVICPASASPERSRRNWISTPRFRQSLTVRCLHRLRCTRKLDCSGRGPQVSFAFSALLDSGYTLMRQSTEPLPNFTLFFVTSLGVSLGWSVLS